MSDLVDFPESEPLTFFEIDENRSRKKLEVRTPKNPRPTTKIMKNHENVENQENSENFRKANRQSDLLEN